MRFGSAGDPFRWSIPQPPQSGPSTFQSLRLPSAVRTNAPLRVPTSTRTPLISRLLSSVHNVRRPGDGKLIVRSGHIHRADIGSVHPEGEGTYAALHGRTPHGRPGQR